MNISVYRPLKMYVHNKYVSEVNKYYAYNITGIPFKCHCTYI